MFRLFLSFRLNSPISSIRILSAVVVPSSVLLCSLTVTFPFLCLPSSLSSLQVLTFAEYSVKVSLFEIPLPLRRSQPPPAARNLPPPNIPFVFKVSTDALNSKNEQSCSELFHSPSLVLVDASRDSLSSQMRALMVLDESAALGMADDPP